MRIIINIPDRSQPEVRLIAALQTKFTDEDGVAPVVDEAFVTNYVRRHLASLIQDAEYHKALRAVVRPPLPVMGS